MVSGGGTGSTRRLRELGFDVTAPKRYTLSFLLDGYPHHDIGRRVQQIDGLVQQARGGFDRIASVIHAEAEQKRTRPDGLPDRVEGRIESLIQSRMRSREHDIGR